MHKKIISFLAACLLLFAAGITSSFAANPRVNIQTNYGDIILELYPQQAPLTVTNFLSYVDSGFYAGTLFHRVIKDFMIQGGGYDEDYKEKPTQDPIKNEANNGLSNQRGTIAMARTPDPHSASAQFFINTNKNSALDFKFASRDGWGYCVFGKVIEGMQVVDDIEAMPTGPAGPFDQDAPQGLVVIEKISRIEDKIESVKEGKQ
ncbi:MAG: peptidyl-prolyl cis-trans isomerase [Gammaproteobacteria bacterium]|nr:peptidyl-prolyl cis-trans isomerase [Gammaproteobacteria bacterium]